METKKQAGVNVYRLRGYEFLLPKTYTQKDILISMEYLNMTKKNNEIKGRLYANHYGDYKPVCLNEFTITGLDKDATNTEIEDALYRYVAEGYDEQFVKNINLFIEAIKEPETKSEFELNRYDVKKEKQGKVYGLFFYLPQFLTSHKVEITILYKKNKEGCLDVLTYLEDKKIPYRVKLFSAGTKIDFYDPDRDAILFDNFQNDKEIQSVIENWDILREHMR